jgi:hypothetical protein
VADITYIRLFGGDPGESRNKTKLLSDLQEIKAFAREYVRDRYRKADAPRCSRNLVALARGPKNVAENSGTKKLGFSATSIAGLKM